MASIVDFFLTIANGRLGVGHVCRKYCSKSGFSSSFLLPLHQPPSLSTTAMAHDYSAFVWIWCQNLFPRSLSFRIKLRFMQPIRCRFFVEKQRPVHPPLCAEGRAVCTLDLLSLVLEASAKTWVLASGRAQRRPKGQTTSRAERLTLLSFTFTDPPAFCTFGVFCDFFNATDDVFQVIFCR